MFPSEVAILMAVEQGEPVTARQLTHVTDVVGPALGYLFTSLIRRSYIEPSGSGVYRITLKGREVIAEALSEMAVVSVT